MRRRIYLMRHGAVTYFDEQGHPFPPDQVPLTEDGRKQASAAGTVLQHVCFDRVITSDLQRTVQTAAEVLARASHKPTIEEWPELRELKGGRLANIPDHELEHAFLGAFQGVVPESTQFLAGETIGALFDRVVPAIERLLADARWDTVLVVLHGGVNRAILSYALTGRRTFLGNLMQAPGCINVLDIGSDWVVRAVNCSPTDLAHLSGRSTTMEELLEQYLKYRKNPERIK